jgi:hypothetical protein
MKRQEITSQETATLRADKIADLIAAGLYDEAIAALEAIITEIEEARRRRRVTATGSPGPDPHGRQKTGPESP